MTPLEILEFWFSDQARNNWFSKDYLFDKVIREKFLATYEKAANLELDPWKSSAEQCLALIIVLDQFPRNMFRDEKKAFATDDVALAYCKFAIKNSLDLGLSSEEKMFLYMPLMHSEKLEDQDLAIKLFEGEALDFAKQHRDIIPSLIFN